MTRSSHHDTHGRDGTGAGYFERSKEPLASLALLLPLLVFHELGVVAQEIRGEAPVTVEAYRWIELGVSSSGFLLRAAPAILTLGLLLVLHLARGADWSMPRFLPGWMFLESLGWMAPLLIGQAVLGAAVFASAPAAAASVGGLLNIAIGAGLYEELLFRLMLVGGLDWLLRRVVGLEGWWPGAIAILVSATLFALYHDLSPSQGKDVAGLFVLYAAGGIFFGVLYMTRGFGITAATHAFYDISVLLLTTR